MGYGWNLTVNETLPAVMGIEQEIPIYERASPDRGRTQASAQAKMVQLEKRELKIFFDDFVTEMFPIRTSSELTSMENTFVENGRIYLDQSKNLEFCTVECSNPIELGDRLGFFKHALKQFLSQDQYQAFNDSCSKESTVGFHENYFSSLDSWIVKNTVALDLVPHLVTRIVLTGSGGQTQEGQLCISPRLSWIEKPISTSSTNNRGFIELKSDTHSNFGTRIQVVSSDHLFSSENTMLQASITAFAVRLAEIGRLPKTDINWFLEMTSLNELGIGEMSDLFVSAVNYQQQLLDAAKEYREQCILQELPDIFSDSDVSAYALKLWQHKIDLVRQYSQTQNIDLIADDIEWANKYRLIKDFREKKNVSINSALTSSEVWLLAQSTSFVPAAPVFETMQAPFLDWPNKPISEFSLQRPGVRAEILRLLPELNEMSASRINMRMDWSLVELSKYQIKTSLELPSPFSGDSSDTKTFIAEFSDKCTLYSPRTNNGRSAKRKPALVPTNEVSR